MKSYKAPQIRNVVLLSHGGAGKTSLSEAILFNSGAINRLGKVEDGNTTSDYDPDEIKRKISISLSLLPCEWKDTKINLIDTPGYADFVGEVKAGLRVADGAIIVVCAASGMEVGTEQVWRYTEEGAIPRLIFINKMDRDNADFYRTVEQVQNKFGRHCIPIQLPIGSQATFEGVVDLLSLKALTNSEPKDIPASLQEQVDTFREKLVEAVAETNDDLLNKYLEGEEISEEEIGHALQEGTSQGKIVPILTGAALQNVAITPLLDAISAYLPAPLDTGETVATNLLTQQEETLDKSEPALLTALVFKTSTDPYVGKLTYFRVYGGILYSDSQVWNSNKGRAERVGQLYMLRGKAQEPVPQVVAGDIGAVAKLSETNTGDSLCSRDHPLLLPSIEFPRPVFSVAIHPKTKADLDKMGTALSRLVEEDPTLQVHRDLDTVETILSGMGDSHLEVAAERMRRKLGVDVRIEAPKVAYRETIMVPVKAEYKHKKQTGGHGQYGHVFLELEPLSRGSGFEFAERVVGGAVPKNYIPAVEKGVQEALQEGVVAGYPVTDIKVTLYDGSYHAVDSSDMSFKIAGLQAFKKGATQGQPVLLEPIMNIRVIVPDSFMGDTIGDLNTKRAKVLATQPQDGTTAIDAQVPLAEIVRYATELRSLTQGRGSYTVEFSHYQEVPAHIAQKIISESKREEK